MLLDKKAAADFLGISTKTLDRERDKGTIQWVQVGGQVKFTTEQLEAYIQSRTKGGRTCRPRTERH